MVLQLDGSLLVVGAGKMGGALLAGLLDRGLGADQVLVQDPGPPPAIANLLSASGIEVVSTLPPEIDPPAVILMAVKPQAMDDVFAGVARCAGPQTLTVSIAAGKTLAAFERRLPPQSAVVRAMPNTPASIGRGITVCCPNAHVTDRHRASCEALLSAVGEVGWVEDETLMDAVTAVSGSGPAYVFLLAEAMEAAGVKAGLAPDLSRQLARATVAGAGELLHQASESAAILRNNVTSPGGTTAAALDVLMAKDGLPDLMQRAVAAATKRGRDLAG